jgi:hypothetical protein
MKKNEILGFTEKWLEMETMLHKVSQTQKDNSHMLSFIYKTQKKQWHKSIRGKELEAGRE